MLNIAKNKEAIPLCLFRNILTHYDCLNWPEESLEVIAKPRCTSAPDLPPSLVGFHNLFIGNILRQSLLQSGAA